MRSRRGCGAGGKSTRILGLIEDYWDPIERDFAGIGFDARDWLRGLKPWAQFLNFADMFANTEGSWLWAAQVDDDRFLGHFEAMHEAAMRDPRPPRPPLAGYDALMATLTGLRNDFRASHGLPLLEGPQGPIDKIKDRKKTLVDSKLDAALGYNEEVI